ncbi:MAG TPA: hypothetical protein VF715_13140 [Thermoleophilaceae bacterium]|jgi:hypothetical protein
MLVVLGGSSPWTVDLIERLDPEAVLLVGRDADALDALRRFLGKRSGATIRTSTEPEEALTEASAVLCQARLGGWEGRQMDETGAWRAGGYADETLGLGGLRAALRARDTLARWACAAGTAPVVMLSNPTDLLTRWWRLHSEALGISACEVPSELMVDLPPGTRYLGVNHLGWAVTPAGERVATRWVTLLESGRPEQSASRIRRAGDLAALSSDLRRAIAADDHESFDELILRRPPRWYAQLVVPVLRALLDDPHSFRGVVGLPNGARLPGLPPDLMVESLGSAVEPDPNALPTELVGDIARFARARDHAWNVLTNPCEDTLQQSIAADPFSGNVKCSRELLSWVVGAR